MIIRLLKKVFIAKYLDCDKLYITIWNGKLNN